MGGNNVKDRDDAKDAKDSDDFEVSFILSRDELYTLVLLSGEPSEAGRDFVAGVLAGAVQNDLLGLVEKKMAHEQNGKILLEPVVRMLGAAVCKADKVDVAESKGKKSKNDGIYTIYSPWLKLRCERYARIADCIKLTPLKPGT